MPKSTCHSSLVFSGMLTKIKSRPEEKLHIRTLLRSPKEATERTSTLIKPEGETSAAVDLLTDSRLGT